MVHRLMYYQNPFKWFIESQNIRKTFAYWFISGETRFLTEMVLKIHSSFCLVFLLLLLFNIYYSIIQFVKKLVKLVSFVRSLFSKYAISLHVMNNITLTFNV